MGNTENQHRGTVQKTRTSFGGRAGRVDGAHTVSRVADPSDPPVGPGPTTDPDAPDTFAFPEPVTHGAGITFHYDDLGLYDQARDLWRSEVADPENQPATVVPFDPAFIDRSGDFALRFRSSRWKAGKETSSGGWRQWFKYHLTLKERVVDDRGREHWKTPEVSLDIRLEPQADGLTYKDGNALSLPHGEGTHVWVQTTYPDGPEDVRRRTMNALGTVFDVDPAAVDPDSERITKLEAHVRFDIGLKNEAVECLENSKRLVHYGGGAELKAWQERSRDGWVEARVDTDRWDHLGFERAGYKESIKVYMIGDWVDRPTADPLHHPKLEAAYQGGGRGAHPRLSAWDTVLDRLRHKVAQQARWTGLSPGNLVADPYYLGEHAPLVEYHSLAGRRDDLRAYYDDLRLPVTKEVTKESTRSPYDILSLVLEYNGANYDDLETLTGLSRRTVRYHVERFEELGFVERIGNPVMVVFTAPYVEDIVREVVEGVDPNTVAGKRLERERRATERRERREEREAAAEDGGGFDTSDGSGSSSSSDTDTDGSRSRSLFRYVEEVGLAPRRSGSAPRSRRPQGP